MEMRNSRFVVLLFAVMSAVPALRVSRHFSIRPAQAEYFLTKIPDGLGNRQNNFRFGAGIVFRFG
jgi:hypothetical protein